MPQLFVFLLFSIIPCISSTEKCMDESDFCRYLKIFCRSRDHESLMMLKCAATCGFCKVEAEKEEVEEVKETISGNQTHPRSRPDTNATAEKTATTPKKCVFPKEKRLQTESPSNGSEYTFNANISVVKRKGETVQTMLVKITNSTRVRPAPDSNEALKKVAEAKRNESREISQEKESEDIGEAQKVLVMKKIKLNQLISEHDVDMPRITTAEPSKFSVSLAKTLIKGKCFDEYIYCAEFASLCTHPAFNDVMASHCTLTCKRCDEVDLEDDMDRADCTDLGPDCARYSDVCHDERYLSVTQKFCARTCGYCNPLCRDRHQNCAQFALDGFCSDETYSVDERQFLCGSTCGSC